ncbi:MULTISPECIES: hypothetical protein [Nocardiaceae]|uniref:hypothetical protein n=1 Tax=Nocardiaceae TaxID=85025 RepID=UPI000A84D2F9|nr:MULTISPECIES: hypothetical protein [Rhodococcus]
MNPPPGVTEETATADALLHWTALIAKAAVLDGLVDLYSEARSDIPGIDFRTAPTKGQFR